MDNREIDNDMVQEQNFETAMQLIEDKDWVALRELVARTDDATAEAILESMSANDMHAYSEVANPAPHDSQVDEAYKPLEV